MDVRQFAFLARQPSAALKSRDSFFGLPKRGLALILANALFWQPLLAQADGIVVSAPGTTVGQAGNGVPVVNIATPNGSGLSHNQFKDYNVGANGVILNNATDRTQSTQLGGIILGNPNLTGGAANIILNEVNGGSPSQLRGYTEVAGQSAKVIVANPYGISCNGCGFINTPNVTLTTGKPILDNGRLDRYQVDGGAVTIDGQGLNASNVDRFEIITRSAKINAQINARNLTVIAGRNDVNAQTLNATARADDGSTKPELAIDSSALGGMYAGAIKLVGTEAGVGVKLDGTLAASGGDIQLDANGHLSMAQAAASGAVNIKAASLDAQGPVYAGTALDVQTQGDLNSRKTLAARDSITLTSGGQLTNNGIIEAGVNADNTRNATGDLNLTAQTVNNNASSLVASRNLTVDATQALNNQGGTLSAKQVANVSTGTLDNQNKGRVLSTGSLTLNASQLLNAQGGLLNSSGPLTATLGQLSNRNGEVSSLDTATLNIASLDNVAGLVTAGNALSLTASGAVNNLSGKLTSQGTLNLKAGAVDNSAAGRIASNQGLTANVTSLNNNAGQLTSVASLTLDVNKGQLNNQSGLIRGATLALNNLADVGNQSGEISSAQGFTLAANSLDNTSGKLLSDQGLTLRLDQALTNVKGLISANGLDARADSLNNNSGTLTSDTGLLLNLDGALANTQGEVSSAGTSEVHVASLDNSGGKVTGDTSLSVDVRGALNNRQGVLATGQSASITAASLDNSNTGKVLSDGSLTTRIAGLLDNQNNGLLTAKGAMDVQAGSLDNRGGSLSGKGLLTLQGQSLDNSGGTVSGQQGLTLTHSGDLNNTGGLLTSEGSITATTAGLNNTSGKVSSAGAIALTATGAMTNQNGAVTTDQGLILNSASLGNSGGTLSAKGAVSVTTGAFDNTQAGRLISNDTLTLTAGQVSNGTDSRIASDKNLVASVTGFDQQGGQLFSKTSLSLDLKNGQLNNQQGLINAPLLMLKNLNGVNNQNGEISSAQAFTLASKSLDNSSGKLISNQALTLRVEQALSNIKGLVSAAALQVHSASLDNSGGLLSSRGELGLTVDGAFKNQGGSAIGDGNAQLTAASLDNTDGQVSSKGDLTANVATLTNQNGALIAQGALALTGQTLDNRQKGFVGAAQKTDVNVGTVDNRGGEISSKAAVQVTGQRLDNSDGGLVLAATDLKLNVNNVLNRNKGQLSGQSGVNLEGASLDNSGGSLISQKDLGLKLGGELTNTNGKLASAGALLLKRATEINNQGGQLASQSLLTLFAGSLDNRNRGTVAANGALAVTTTGAVQNSGDGLIYSQNADLKLKAASLDNAKGSIQSQTTLNLDISGDLDNQSGKVIAQAGDVDIKAATIDNRGGTLASLKGALQAKALGGLLRNDFDLNNNRQAGIIQAQSLILTSASLNNNGGRIAAQSGDTVVTTGAFDNRDGGLYAKGAVKVSGSSFDNSGDVRGQVAGRQIDLNLSGALNNQKGIIESDTTLSVSAASVDNQSGQLRALGTGGKTEFQIGGVFDNRSGALETANSDLTLNAGSFQNVGGSVLHVGAGTFDISTANLTNAGGTVVTRGGLTLTADNWTNSSVIQAGRLTVNVNTLNQTAEGQLLTSDSLIGNGGNWSNNGLIASDGSLQLTLGGTYSGSGRASSQGTFGLSAAQVSLATPGSLAGGGTTSIDVGQLINRGRITSASDLIIKAGTVQNIGTLGATEDLTITAQSLINDRDAADLNIRGFVFSGENSTFNVNTFTNNYGEVVSLGSLAVAGFAAGTSAQSFRNISGNIQSTGDMTLAANEVINEREKFQLNQKLTSAGLSITCVQHCSGGWSDRRTQLTLNRTVDSVIEQDSPSATLSAGRNLSITSQQFSNRYSVVSAANDLSIQGDNIVNQAAIGGSGTGNGVYTAAPKIPKAQHNALVQAVAIYNRDHPPSSPVDEKALAELLAKFNPVIFAGINNPIEIKTNGVIAAPAIIQAGGTAKLTASNDISNINVLKTALAVNGRALDTSVGDHKTAVVVVNSQLPPNLAQQQVNPLTLPGFDLPSGQNGLFRLSQQDSSAPTSLAPQSWTMGSAIVSNEQRQQALPVSPGREIELSGASQAAASTLGQVEASRQKVDVVAGTDALNIVAPTTSIIGAELPGRTVVADPLQAVPVGTAVTTTDTQTINRVQGLPSNVTSSQPHKYLIETNPALTDLKQFMSSDYLLSNLGYNPDDSWKRLGDGFYEQRLIQQAVVARTGQRFLAGQNTDEQLFKYLMDNAIKSKQSLNLAVGVSLTSEQVAALTHDIVWLEKNEVNGEQVLVPVLYLAHSNNRLAPNGALIAGNDLNLIAGKNLDNAGTLRATNNLSASAGQNLVNSGLIEAGNRLDLLAGNNLVNKSGGIIAGRDVSLRAINGDVINERTVTNYQEDHGNNRKLQQGYVDSAARIEAANNLSVLAGRDVNNQGGALKSGADTVIQGGRDVNITSAEQMSRVSLNTKISSQDIKQFGSTLEAGRDLKVDAGRDIKAIASQIDAKRDIAMAATGDLTLASAADEQHSGYNSKKLKIQEDHVQQVSTTVKAGGDVALSAGQDLALIASRVTAGDEAYLVAGKNLELKAAEDQDYSFYSKTKKSSSGKKFRLDETASTTNVGSLVTSGSNSTLVAGENLLLAGSAVTAENGAAKLVAGKDVQILAVTDSDSARHERKESKSSWGGFKSSKVQDQVDEKRTTAVGSMVSGDTVTVAGGQDVKVTGSSLVSTGDMTVQAGRDLTIDAAQNTFSRTDMHKEKNRDLTGVLTGNKLGLDDITGNQHLFINSQKHNGTATETTLTGSTVGSSAGNVKLEAGRELKVVASDLVSTKDMDLKGSNVTIAAGMENASQSTVDKSKSLAVGRVIGGTVVDTARSIRDGVEAAKNADDPRLKAVKLAQVALNTYNLGGQMADANGQGSGFANKQGGTASNGSLIKIGTELANTSSKNTTEYRSETAKQSTLNAGQGLSIVATGKAAETQGDIHVIGSELKAANTTLIAKNDIILESAQNTTERKNDSNNNKTSIGASFNIGEQNGFTLDLGAQIAKGMGSGSSVTQVNTKLDTGALVLSSGQDTTLAGAQVRADSIKADIGGNLNIASRQDIDTQKSKQSSAGAGASICVPPFCYGTTVTASGSMSAGNMNSDYKAVTDQTGLYAGKDGYTLDVGKNTTLQGAVIASEASADKNLLITDRLLTSDIKNTSKINSTSASAGISGGSSGIAMGPPMGAVLSESDSSKTRAAVSEGTIVVRNPEGANDLVGLNRDTQNANKHLDKPDEKAMRERMDLINSSAQLAITIGSTIGKAKIDESEDPNSDAGKAARQKLLERGIAEPTTLQVRQQAESDYGVGSSFQRTTQTVTAIIQGIAGGNVGAAIAGAAAPYLAQEVKDLTKGDDNANLMAHAVLGAVLARAGGNSALVGAGGAVAAEVTARLIRNELYGNVSNNDLTPEQKQTISALSTLAAGIAGSAVGKDALSAVAAAQVGKNAVENNYLSKQQKVQKEKELGESEALGEKLRISTKWELIDAGQDASFAAGAVTGVPEGVLDTIKGIVEVAGSPIETGRALKSLFESGDVLGNVSESVKQSYIERIDKLNAEYERAGLGGSFNAGRETGKLISDVVALGTGVGGALKSGALLVEKVTAKVAVRAELAGVKIIREGQATPPVSKLENPASQADGDFGYLNQPGPSKPAAFFDAHASAKEFISNGRISAADLERLVPPGTPNSFKPSATITDGSKFQYKLNGQTVEIKWHAPDANAAAKFPGSNAGSGWTAQIKIGSKLLGQDGVLYRKPSNVTHIPVDF